MTVVNPKSISGINSITTGSGSDDILTIHNNNGTERLRIDSTGTTKIVTGIVTTLTATTGIVTTLTTNTLTANSTTKVGSGVTLSPDGDVFFTGIATGNGSGLTALNASNLGSGTVPTARLGSGTASSSTFLRGDSTFATVTSTTINNNADNRLITGSGTANTLEGEANLTYDGTTLNIIDSAGGSGSHRLTIGNSHDLRLYHDGNTNIGHYGAGNFYLTSNSGADLYVRSADDIFLQPQDGEDGIKVIGDGAVELYHDGTKQCETASDGLKFPSGKGINFNATADGSGTGVTAGSELLDDYEEGTWTPGLAFGATDTGMTYSSRSGSYVKIGRFVYCQGQLDLSSKGSSTGDATFTGLPFTVGDYVTGTSQEGSGFITWWANMGSGSIPTTFWISQGGTSAAIYRALEGSHGGIQTQTHSYWNNNSQVRFLLQYMAA